MEFGGGSTSLCICIYVSTCIQISLTTYFSIYPIVVLGFDFLPFPLSKTLYRTHCMAEFLKILKQLTSFYS